MKHNNMKLIVTALAAAFSSNALAVGVGTDVQLAPVVVKGTGTHAPLAADIPSSTESKTAEELRKQNLFNPEDALRYMPNTTIRKRYIGDRNALIGGRDFGPMQPSRALVYVDGYLISNFLGRFDAPRWNMVTPEALERVDVLYGPFSALFPGNSIGTTVVMTERVPKETEGSVRVTGYSQHYSQYGDSDNYNGGQLSAYVGGRAKSGLWGALTANHQDSTSQPMQYYTVSANAAGAFPAVAGPAPQVTGIQYDTDPNGNKRAVFGAHSGAIDHTVQNNAKFKMGYAFTPELEGSALLGWWTNNTSTRNRTFLNDASGSEVWQGKVADGANTFNIPASAFAPSMRDEEHLQSGATLKTKRASGWNGSIVASGYRIVSDAARQANNPDPIAAGGGVGTVTRRDGTGWNTFEMQALYKPMAGDFGGGRHTLVFGLHRNAYTLKNVVNNASNWRDAETTRSQHYRGETEVYALYAQDIWQLNKDLKLTTGWRVERFRAHNGEQLARGTSCTAVTGEICTPNGDGTFNKTVPYGSRTLTGNSPKVSLAWTASDDLLFKASYGHGVRFPNVEELYNGTVTATSVTRNDPNLKAERSNAFDLTAEKFWENHTLRVSMFHSNVLDTILRQTDITVLPFITNVSNVDKVRTSGVEFVWRSQDIAIHGLSLDANAAFTNSKVVENTKDPASEGKHWLRVPKTRGSVLLAYRPNAQWMGSIGWRYQGRAYNSVYNLDINPNVYGGISTINQFDLRLSYKPQPKLELAVGVDNVTNQNAYQFHPYPGRTMFLELRASL